MSSRIDALVELAGLLMCLIFTILTPYLAFMAVYDQRETFGDMPTWLAATVLSVIVLSWGSSTAIVMGNASVREYIRGKHGRGGPTTKVLTWFLPNNYDKHGIIYVLLRDDGVYKIGQTKDLRNRLRSLTNEYGKAFTVVRAWYVSNVDYYERLALGVTRDKCYNEPGHVELRDLSRSDVDAFVSVFDEIVRNGK